MYVKTLTTKTLCWVVIVMLLLQSCSIYKRTSVTLNEAARTNTSVLVTRTNDRTVRFKRIEQIDGSYFGWKNVKGEKVKIPLTNSDIKSVRVLDKTNTILLNIGLCVVTVGIIVVALLIDDLNSSMDFGSGGAKTTF